MSLITPISHAAYPTQNPIYLDEATKKIANLSQLINFIPKMAAFNSRGVGVFGFEGDASEDAFYWASPNDEEVKKIKGECYTYFFDGGGFKMVDFISHDHSVTFNFDFEGREFTLNGRVATRIRVL